MITTTSTPNDATSNANNNTLIKSDLEGGVKNLNKSKNKNPFLKYESNGGKTKKL